MIELRPMSVEDLSLVARWLREPHVARWWLTATTLQAELSELSARISGAGDTATRMLTVLELDERRHAGGAAPVGWCQWYPYDAYPEEAAAVGAHPGDCGIDYAIGDRAATGRGLGRELIAHLVAEVRRHHPVCGVVVGPDAANAASRRVLELGGFALLAVRPVATEPTDDPVAIYRLAGDVEPPSRGAAAHVIPSSTGA